VDVEHEAVAEIGVGSSDSSGVELLGAARLQAVPIPDVDLPHKSNISDDEEFRFQLPVTVYGYELARHGAGTAFSWGESRVTFRHGVQMRLVNVGASGELEAGRLGYPVCLVCGQSRSPFSSQDERDHFQQTHLERCGREPERVGFYTDVVADALCVCECADKEEAYSLAESLRRGMAQVLEMELGDVHVLVIGEPGTGTTQALLYDPMPGGSGLLNQAIENWGEVVDAALGVVRDCPSECERSCIDCLWSFRNAYYHRFLDRKIAAERMTGWGRSLEWSHDIPAKVGDRPDDGSGPVNDAEQKLLGLLLAAGFAQPQSQYEIQVEAPYRRTLPDFFYEGEDEEDPGVCIYLDGLSAHIHGNPETRAKDARS